MYLYNHNTGIFLVVRTGKGVYSVWLKAANKAAGITSQFIPPAQK
jgi:hypothetical protein